MKVDVLVAEIGSTTTVVNAFKRERERAASRERLSRPRPRAANPP